jgi:formylglycine-generating enzyme required for sulfatase activity
MEFVPVAGTGVLFCRVKTRVKDFGAYAREAGYVQRGGIGVMKVNTNDGSYGLKWGLDAKASWEVPGFAQGPEHPVVGVSWEEANAFCAWLTKHDRAAGVLPAGASYRLPGDEEWSRAVGTGKYPWGNAFPPPRDAGNYGDAAFLKLVSSLSGGAKWSGDLSEVNDGYERTSPAGSFAANRLGIFDLGGNAWEWCRNEYRASMNDADALEKFPLLKVERGSDGTPYRVLRGGSWNLGDEVYLRSSSRSLGRPSGRYDFSGFRCVLVVSGG